MKTVAVDATVSYASIASYTTASPTEVGVTRLARIVPTRASKDAEDRSLVAEHRLRTEFAALVVNAVTRSGAPDLVVLRRPTLSRGAGTRKAGPRRASSRGTTTFDPDTSAIRRMGVHWELVRLFGEAGVPVAEIGVITAELAVTGGRVSGGYSVLADAVTSLVPDLKPPTITEDARAKHEGLAERAAGDADPLYRMSTPALAWLGAVALHMKTPLKVTERTVDLLRKGGDFPPGITLPKTLGDTSERYTEKARRAEAFIERKKEELGELSVADLEAMGRPNHDDLAEHWDDLMRAVGKL